MALKLTAPLHYFIPPGIERRQSSNALKDPVVVLNKDE
jgi:hypothetical protein